MDMTKDPWLKFGILGGIGFIAGWAVPEYLFKNEITLIPVAGGADVLRGRAHHEKLSQKKEGLEEGSMVTALVLLTVSRDRVNEIAAELADLKGITEVYSIAGRYDLAVIIRAKDSEQLADIVTHHMLKVRGILTSETLIAFRVHSKHDLEAMFAIGM